jgi:syntaxin 1B/2/3
VASGAFSRGGRTELALICCNAQAGLLKTKFQEAIQNYQQVEQRQRNAQKQRMERQYRIGKNTYFPSKERSMEPNPLSVNPNATQEEVRAVVNDESGGQQIFQQAVGRM